MLGSCLCLRLASWWMPLLQPRPSPQHVALLSAAFGSAPLAARLGPPGALSPACAFWEGAGMQAAGALLIALAPGARGAEVPESRDQVTGDQLWAGLAAGPRIQGSERGLEGPASSRGVNSAPRAARALPPWPCLWCGRL